MPIGSIIPTRGSTFQKALIFLLRLAWKSRVRLPYLIVIAFMVFDIRLSVEVEFNVERQTPEELGIEGMDSDSDSDSDDDDDDDTDQVVQIPIL